MYCMTEYTFIIVDCYPIIFFYIYIIRQKIEDTLPSEIKDQQ